MATLHTFNGWADKFLATPPEGLKDGFISLEAKLGRWSLVAVYHDFSADSGGADWGTEIDAQVLHTAPWKQKFALKYADYRSADRASDTTKIWVWTQWGF